MADIKKFFVNLAVAAEGKNVNNLLASVWKDQKEAGTIEYINNRTTTVKAFEFLTILQVQKYLGLEAFENAVKKFLISEEGLAPVDADAKLKIVSAIGLEKVLPLFEDRYFEGTGTRGVDHIEDLFDYALPKQREAMINGFLMYFGQNGNDIHWTSEHDEMFNFLADRLVIDLNQYGDINPELAKFLVDNYGINISFNKNNNAQFVRILDVATHEGIGKFFETRAFNEKEMERLPIIERLLFVQNKETIVAMTGALGCSDSNIEGYLIYTDKLPNESISKRLCHPVNFQMLIANKGVETVFGFFPKEYKETMPNLWNWIRNYDKPVIDRKKCNSAEWAFVLANDAFCSNYLQTEGAYLSEDDLFYLVSLRKFETIAKYRGIAK